MGVPVEPGGVDDVGEVVGAVLGRGGDVAGRRTDRVDDHDAVHCERAERDAVDLGNHGAEPAVGDHVPQPLGGVGRVERHVRGTAHVGGEHRDDHVRATLDRDAHAVARCDPGALQAGRHGADPGAHLAIRERHAAGGHGGSIGGALGLSGDQPVDRRVAVERHLGAVDRLEQCELGRAEEREPGDRGRRRGQGGHQQHHDLVGEAIERRRVHRAVGDERPPVDRDPQRRRSGSTGAVRAGVGASVEVDADVRHDGGAEQGGLPTHEVREERPVVERGATLLGGGGDEGLERGGIVDRETGDGRAQQGRERSQRLAGSRVGDGHREIGCAAQPPRPCGDSREHVVGGGVRRQRALHAGVGTRSVLEARR